MKFLLVHDEPYTGLFSVTRAVSPDSCYTPHPIRNLISDPTSLTDPTRPNQSKNEPLELMHSCVFRINPSFFARTRGCRASIDTKSNFLEWGAVQIPVSSGTNCSTPVSDSFLLYLHSWPCNQVFSFSRIICLKKIPVVTRSLHGVRSKEWWYKKKKFDPTRRRSLGILILDDP